MGEEGCGACVHVRSKSGSRWKPTSRGREVLAVPWYLWWKEVSTDLNYAWVAQRSRAEEQTAYIQTSFFLSFCKLFSPFSVAGQVLCPTLHVMSFTLLEVPTGILKVRADLCSANSQQSLSAGPAGNVVPCSQPALFYFHSWSLWMSNEELKCINNKESHPLSCLQALYTFPTYFSSGKGKSLCLRSWSYLWSNFSLPVMSKYWDLLWSLFALIKMLLCYY